MPPPEAKRIHDRYALCAELASGGMATVHIGRLLGPVGFARTVAIKRLRPQFADSEEFRKMFVDEARMAARVRHPNVVQTLDVVAGEHELFVVMDYVHGESLTRLLRECVRRGEVPDIRVATTIFAGVLHGLHAAHEAKSDRGRPLGIIHRDVSPQNIIVGTDGVARVLDFGVAKAAGRLHTTREGSLKGKLAYMSPEQIQNAVTQSTDIYAASIVLWETLTGRRLYGGDSEGAVMNRILESKVAPPSAHRQSIPGSLDAIVLKGLARDQTARFASARDMALALERAVGVVPASQVGAWVEAMRGKELDERAALIAEIEASSAERSPNSILLEARPNPRRSRATSDAASRDSTTAPGYVGGRAQTPGPTHRAEKRAYVLGSMAAIVVAGVVGVVGLLAAPRRPTAAREAPVGSTDSVLLPAPTPSRVVAESVAVAPAERPSAALDAGAPHSAVSRRPAPAAASTSPVLAAPKLEETF